jgi:aminobenzoyl-glutamate transport protein
VLDWVERIGNLLPHPFFLFLFLVVLTAAVSWILAAAGVSVASGSEVVAARSVLSREGFVWAVLNLVPNFAQFPPLGLVLVMLMGVGVAEGSGLITAVMRGVALAVPKRMVVPVLFGIAVCGNIGSDAAIVVLPPLAAAIFRQIGRNPIAGLIVGYVGVTAGFAANLAPSGTDVLAMSLTNAATAHDPEVSVLANYYFTSSSVFVLTAIGTLVTLRVTEPRLGPGKAEAVAASVEPLSPVQRRGLRFAAIALVITGALWLSTIVPEGGLLRTQDGFWRSPFFKGLVPVLFSMFTVGGVAFGIGSGSIDKPEKVVHFMTASVRSMAPYIVLVLIISQFTNLFQFTRIDRIIAIEGAALSRALGFERYPIVFLVAFIVGVGVLDLFIGSLSAKWAILAPIFVPMFMALGYHPAFTQLLYRVGDSITNCVTPLNPYFPLLLGWIAEVDKDKARIGTVLSYLVPYAAALLAGSLAMVVAWYALGLPIGPDGPIHLAR